MKLLFSSLFLFVVTLSFSQSIFQKAPDPSMYPQRGNVLPIAATIPYQGYDETQAYLGEGEYEIFLDNLDGVLDQPIIILDGFDPGDSRDIGGLYASLSFGGQNLADILRDEGYDIVVLNAPQYTTGGKDIDGGSDYIQRNAFVLISLIQEINAQKVGDGELVVLGPSMGGLIGRYALAYMEQNSLESETRLFISFDSPQRGANIPISLQYLINYFGQEIGDPTALAIIDNVLNSPAAKEMLVDHLAGHLLPGSNSELDPTKLLPFGAPDFRDAFQAELDALGFASNVRNVAMINGTDLGTTIGTPGMTVVDTNISVDTFTSVDISLNFTPEASQTITVTDVTAFFIGIPVGGFEAEAQSPSTNDGVDASPGGTASISGALGGAGNPILDDFIAALQQDTYSFIPTMSSLAIDTPDWFATPNLADSPFVNFYIPSTNEDHVTVTAASAQFALDEIRLPLVGIDDNQVDLGIYLLENPIQNTIRLGINGAQNNLDLKLYSITGQLLAEKTFTNPGGSIAWEQNLQSGFYMLNVTDGNLQQTLKIVVK